MAISELRYDRAGSGLSLSSPPRPSMAAELDQLGAVIRDRCEHAFAVRRKFDVTMCWSIVSVVPATHCFRGRIYDVLAS